MRAAAGLTRAVVTLVATASLAAACSSGGGSSSSKTGNGGTSAKTSDCDPAALTAAKGPVNITFWHVMGDKNADWLDGETKKFNASQAKVHVNLVNENSYQESFTKYKATLTGASKPPALMQMEETTVGSILDSQSTVPVQDCINAEKYDTSDFLPNALAYYSKGSTLEAMPWNISNPILYFNTAIVRKAGLDPTKPPTTFAELRAWSQKIVSSGASKYGIALRIEPYVFEFLLAKSGGHYVNNGNGRTKRATAAGFGDATGKAIFQWWHDMVADKLALDTGGTPGNFDHLLAIGNGRAAMAIEGSGVLGIIKAVLASGQYKGVTVGAAPLPALKPGGGVPVGDGSLWIPKATSAVQRAAAWEYIKFLSSTQEQAALAAFAGFAPARKSATTQPGLVAKWQSEPVFKVGYEQLLASPVTDSTSGSLIGDYQGVRDAVRLGLTEMLERNKSVDQALQDAVDAATKAIQTYNDRVG